MNYCVKGQWVIIITTGQIGAVVEILNRRDHKRDGKVLVQCGADGPFVKALMGELEECSIKDYEIAMGVRHYDD